MSSAKKIVAGEGFERRKFCFASSHQTLYGQKFPKGPNKNELYSFSNRVCAVTTGIVSTIKTSIKSVKLVEKETVGSFSIRAPKS